MSATGRTKRAARAALWAAAACVCAACPQKTAVWVAPGSTAQRVVFQISDERGSERAITTGGIRVDRCTHEPTGYGAEWNVGPSGASTAVRTVVYGTVPTGWESSEGPKPLAPGCYQVSTSGSGSATFDVTADGRVVEHAAAPRAP